LLLLGSACAAPPRAEAPIALAVGPQVIALPRVTFSDDRPDPFCDLDAARRIYTFVRWQLEKKGYRVVGADFPALENSNRPDPWATATAAELLRYLPATADALLRVRVDRYLALDFCPREAMAIFELEGSAELFAAGHPEPVWRSSASEGTITHSRFDDPVFLVGGRFADELLASLPSAP
jgi:hypothetical protein